jgi:hypothetical protein
MRSTPGDRGTSGLYDAVVNYGCLEILEDHFETEGMVLHHNTAEQWAGLLPDAEFVDAMPDERLTGDETLVLLLLSLAWNEGVSEANIGHRGVVETTANAILSRLFDITRKQERIRPPRLKDILRGFARRSLVEIGEEDPATLDYVIAVRPMIGQLTGIDALRRLEAFAKAGLSDAGEDEPDDTEDCAAASDSDDAEEEVSS